MTLQKNMASATIADGALSASAAVLADAQQTYLLVDPLFWLLLCEQGKLRQQKGKMIN